MNFSINQFKSSIGLSVTGFLIAPVIAHCPNLWLVCALIFLGVACWIVYPQYDKEILNDALLYYLGAVGISEADQQQLRCCIYVPSKENLKMVSDYMPTGSASTFIQYRKHLPQSKGIVGRAFSKMETLVDVQPAMFSTTEEYKPYLLDWGFNSKDIELLDKTRKGFCAIPILKQKVGNTGKMTCVGVLYLDTLNPNLLDLSDADLVDRLESAAMLFEPILSLMTK